MLVKTQSNLALRCPQCGKMEIYVLSRFACNGGDTARITCECGAGLLSVCRKGKGIFRLQVDCLMCESKHTYSYKAEDLWNKELLTLICDSTGVEIAFIGSRRPCRRVLQG